MSTSRVARMFLARLWRTLLPTRRPLEADVYKAAVSRALIRRELIEREVAEQTLGRDFPELKARIVGGYSLSQKNRKLEPWELRPTRRRQERAS